MREIKFRAWDEIVKVMRSWEELGSQPVEHFFNRGDIVIMQFTGFHDKNGKEIYEGDVLSFNYKNGFIDDKDNGEVFFHGGSFCVGSRNGWKTFNEILPDTKVIGNIHENPDEPSGVSHMPTAQEFSRKLKTDFT